MTTITTSAHLPSIIIILTIAISRAERVTSCAFCQMAVFASVRISLV